jgi:hypothetical protein
MVMGEVSVVLAGQRIAGLAATPSGHLWPPRELAGASA